MTRRWRSSAAPRCASPPSWPPSFRTKTSSPCNKLVLAAPVSDHVIDYAVRLASATRPANPTAPQITRDFVEWGAGPRASQYLVLGAKAVALLKGKLAAETEDVREVALPVLQHRVLTNYRATGAGKRARDIVGELLRRCRRKLTDPFARSVDVATQSGRRSG